MPKPKSKKPEEPDKPEKPKPLDIETLDDGDGPMVLDGRNRYDACLIAGVEPRFRVLSDNINPQDHLISKNLMRRSSSKLERAIYAARMVTVEHGGDRRSGSRPQNEVLKIITRADAARRIGVSQIAVERATFILDHCVPELLAGIDVGIDWLTLGFAHKLAHSSDEDQRLWLKNKEHVIKPVKRTARPPRVPIPWTDSQLKALSDPEAAVVFEKVATRSFRRIAGTASPKRASTHVRRCSGFDGRRNPLGFLPLRPLRLNGREAAGIPADCSRIG